MSHQSTFIFTSSNIPTAEDINRDLELLGLPCTIASTPTLNDANGAFSATITTKGIERSLQFEDSTYRLDELRERAGERDRAVDFLLGTDMAEGFLVSAVGAALATLCGALIYYEPDDLYYTPAEIADEAHSILESVN